jgi:hypothetical protein
MSTLVLRRLDGPGSPFSYVANVLAGAYIPASGCALGARLSCNRITHCEWSALNEIHGPLPHQEVSHFARPPSELLIKNIESLGEQEIVSSYSDHNLIFNDFTSKKIDILKKKTKFQILNKKNFMDASNVNRN